MKNTLLFWSLLLIVGTVSHGQKNVRVELEQTFVYEGDTLKGTLLSSGKSFSKFNKLPLVLFISGSGPTDRNGNSILVAGPNDCFKQLADSLLKLSVASYRYDKLGIAESQISKTEADLRFEDNVNVTLAAIAKMKELGFKKIIIMGHSEGSLVGMLAAQQSKVKGYISLAGLSLDALATLKIQLKDNLPEEMAQSTIVKLDSIKDGHTITSYNPGLAALLRPSVQPYLRSFFTYTPTDEIQKVEVPVMIIQGERDMQVSVEASEELRKAKPEANYKLYPTMNHVLKVVDETEEQNIASYGDPDFPLEPALATDIASWVKGL